MTIYIRHQGPPVHGRQFGPKDESHPSVGIPCPACDHEFRAGDHTTLIPIGPGADPDDQEKCRSGRWYPAIAIEVHWACATGQLGSDEDQPSTG